MKIEDYNEYYIQNSNHYLIPKDVFIELFEEMENWREEAKELKKQLEYLRSGEYYNQLRFENEMLQQVVDTNGVPSEVYDYIDCTHRNTELLNQQKEFINWLKAMSKMYEEQYKDIDVAEHYNCVEKKYKEIIGGKE